MSMILTVTDIDHMIHKRYGIAFRKHQHTKKYYRIIITLKLMKTNMVHQIETDLMQITIRSSLQLCLWLKIIGMYVYKNSVSQIFSGIILMLNAHVAERLGT